MSIRIIVTNKPIARDKHKSYFANFALYTWCADRKMRRSGGGWYLLTAGDSRRGE